MSHELPKYEGEKFDNGFNLTVNDCLTIEEALQININQSPFTVIMRSPGYEQDLVRGLLHNEDIYNGNSKLDLKGVNVNKLNYITEVNVDIDEEFLGGGYLSSRSMLSVSSCGICGKRELGDLSVKGEKLSGSDFNTAIFERMFLKMKNEQKDFSKSGGSHAASAFNKTGDMLIIREDIGRHNAVDKVVGGLLNASILSDAIFLLVSGRVSYEIVTKTFRAKIPILLAVSAPSTLAIDFAKELGVTVFGFCRDKKATRYS